MLEPLDDFKLVRLLPDQISYHWENIKEGVIKGLGIEGMPDASERANGVLQGSLCGDYDVWIGLDMREDGVKIYGILITTIVAKSWSEPKRLWMYCVYGYRPFPEEVWGIAVETLRKFALRNGCGQIMAYSKVQKVVDMCGNGLRADVDTRVILFEVGG